MAISYCVLRKRPTDLQIAHTNKESRNFLDYQDRQGATRGYLALLPHQVDELQRATSSNTSRNVITANYRDTGAQWVKLAEQWANRIANSDLRVSSRK